MRSHIGLVGTGQLGIWLQAASLWVGVAPSLAVKLGAALPAALVSHVLVRAFLFRWLISWSPLGFFPRLTASTSLLPILG